jgi:glycerate 2-kinase
MKIANMEEIGGTDRRRYILEIIEKVMNELTPENAIKGNFHADISKYDKIYVMGFGKAAYSMYRGIRDYIIKKLCYAGIIIPEDENPEFQFPELEILKGTHPYVSQLTVDSSVKLLSGVRNASKNDLIIVLISGGGSSLFEIPEPGIGINEIMEASREIMNNDGDIYTLNRIRSMLSSVKGGKLAKILYPASIVSYIISDVIYDDMGIIASGPLVKPQQPGNISGIIDTYVSDKNLASILKGRIVSGNLEDKYYSSIENHIILRNNDFVSTIFSRIEGEKINLGSNINGDVNQVSSDILSILRNVYSLKGMGFWFVCGGETTVNVHGNGSGGRNQELVLRLLKGMKPGEEYTFCSMGTDGIDGKSNAAGGIVDQDTRIPELDRYLQDNDSSTALSLCHGAIVTGRTGNNVSDIIAGYYSGANNNF